MNLFLLDTISLALHLQVLPEVSAELRPCRKVSPSPGFKGEAGQTPGLSQSLAGEH